MTATWDAIDLAVRRALPIALDGANVAVRRAASSLIRSGLSGLVPRGVLLAALSERIAGDAQALRALTPIADAKTADIASRHAAADWLREIVANAGNGTAEAVRLGALTVAECAQRAAAHGRRALDAAEATKLALRSPATGRFALEHVFQAALAFLVPNPACIVAAVSGDPVATLHTAPTHIQVAHDLLMTAGASRADRELLWSLGLAVANDNDFADGTAVENKDSSR